MVFDQIFHHTKLIEIIIYPELSILILNLYEKIDNIVCNLDIKNIRYLD
jgi:hypothetical protein